jgi:hypothetical protein
MQKVALMSEEKNKHKGGQGFFLRRLRVLCV